MRGSELLPATQILRLSAANTPFSRSFHTDLRPPPPAIRLCIEENLEPREGGCLLLGVAGAQERPPRPGLTLYTLLTSLYPCCPPQQGTRLLPVPPQTLLVSPNVPVDHPVPPTARRFQVVLRSQPLLPPSGLAAKLLLELRGPTVPLLCGLPGALTSGKENCALVCIRIFYTWSRSS